MRSSASSGPRVGGGEPEQDLRPQTLLERQESLSQRILAMQRRRRERFFLRAQMFSLRKEAARALYLVLCLLLDTVVIPEPAFLYPSPAGWAVVIVSLVVAVYVEYRVYARFFSLPPMTET